MDNYRTFHHFTSQDQNKRIIGANLNRPNLIGLVETDDNQLKYPERMQYFHLPKNDKYPLDLNQGYENYKSRIEDHYKDRLNKVAFVIVEKALFSRGRTNTDDVLEKTKDYNYDVITHLRVLSRLMQASYIFGPNNKSGEGIQWCVVATFFKKKLFLSEKCNDPTWDLVLNSCHHFKFKQYCFSDGPHIEPDSSQPIDESQQLFGVFTNKVSNLNLIYSAELCGIQSRRKLRDVNDALEVGRCSFVYTGVVKESLYSPTKSHRMLQRWTKAYLMGADNIFIGFKTNEGLVKRSDVYTLTDFSSNQQWSPQVCIRFVYTFIAKVIDEMNGVDCPLTSFEFVFNSRKEHIEYRTHLGRSKYTFLSYDFVEYLSKTL